MELSEDCWESIFRKLSHHDFKSISLVSKQFFTISNNLFINLIITYSENHHLPLPRLLNRFTVVKSIRFPCEDPYMITHSTSRDRNIVEIAHSGLKNLQELVLGCRLSLPVQGIKELGFANMRSLKKLCCKYVNSLNDDDLSVIASSLPWLEELDISSINLNDKVTDKGIAELAANLSGLLLINLSHSKSISDQSLYSLLSNCPRIEEIYCWSLGVTVEGFIDAICGYPNLICLKIHHIVDYVKSNPNCCYLRFVGPSRFIGSGVQRILASFEEANLPLHKLVFCETFHFTYLHISSLVKFLHKLRAIELHNCDMLTNATFCLIVENCPSLTEFQMSSSRLGIETSLLVLKENYAIKILILYNSKYMKDETLKRIVLSFPNLECLDVRFCPKVAVEGIGYVRNYFPQINLKTSRCL